MSRLGSEILGLLAGLRMVWAHRREVGRWPNPIRPQTFNDRIIHRALFERDEILCTMSDKVAVRQLIAERIGERYVVPLLGEWSDPAEIDFDKLPSSVVLKPRASSGAVLIVEEGARLDRKGAVERMRKWLRPSFDRATRLEWAYHGRPRTIIAEPLLLGPDGGPAPDLDVYVMHGRSALLRLFVGAKGAKRRRDAWFDRSGRQVKIGGVTASSRQSLSPTVVAEAIALSEALTAGYPGLRIDFYITPDGLKVGEMTIYAVAGQHKFRDPSHDWLLGRWWAEGGDASELPDFIDPPPVASLRRAIAPTEPAGRWLRRFEDCAAAGDTAGAGSLFSHDASRALDELPGSGFGDFRFSTPVLVGRNRGLSVIHADWALRRAGVEAASAGRCTIVLQLGLTNLICVHAHFSAEPSTRRVI